MAKLMALYTSQNFPTLFTKTRFKHTLHIEVLSTTLFKLQVTALASALILVLLLLAMIQVSETLRSLSCICALAFLWPAV